MNHLKKRRIAAQLALPAAFALAVTACEGEEDEQVEIPEEERDPAEDGLVDEDAG